MDRSISFASKITSNFIYNVAFIILDPIAHQRMLLNVLKTITIILRGRTEWLFYPLTAALVPIDTRTSEIQKRSQNIDRTLDEIKDVGKQRAVKSAERCRVRSVIATARRKVVNDNNVHIKYVEQDATIGLARIRHNARIFALTVANDGRAADSSFDSRDIFVGTVCKQRTTHASTSRLIQAYIELSELVLVANEGSNCKPTLISPGGPCL
jgi:plasmid stabilization system protein ParE